MCTRAATATCIEHNDGGGWDQVNRADAGARATEVDRSQVNSSLDRERAARSSGANRSGAARSGGYHGGGGGGRPRGGGGRRR